jgi:hypothetical protein
MIGRESKRRLAVLFPRLLLVVGAAGCLQLVLACVGSKIAGPDVTACTVQAPCPCEQDPTQGKCKGFNDRGDADIVLPDAGATPEPSEAGDEGGGGDAASDAGDASDGSG